MTILEVVIVVLVLLALVGFLLSFAARQRELSYKVLCANNLKRIGEGIIAFEDGPKGGPAGRGFLPPSRIADGYATWPVLIAPFLEPKNPLAAWDIEKPYASQPDSARKAFTAWLVCPARHRTTRISATSKDGDDVPGFLGDFACASGDGDPKRPWTTAEANGAMILGEVLEQKGDDILRWQGRSSRDEKSLPRGTSQTILVGDKHVPLDRFGDATAGDGSIYSGALPASSARIGGPGYGLAQSPTAPFNTNFGSMHTGLCQFLHADGRVHAYKIDMSEEILGKLIRRE